MKAFPKAFPSEGKVAEAARSGAKTDEVECLAAVMCALRVMLACGA